eukprot:CAMPEP_0114367754 /NCGR_PEP_ID=MMETSP0101-20121206/30305_1 /TAXON_ID=38822 ORGANISM="Pteridomonas danica, Strain PT" /NCGR_SAMPLE_ID=MMETSP0101 /ASSEMBLY_ACC=CAM_ASM_000211 /LENGTH=88 /DNA_ID=CAMNT_0001517557 /DNA_START=13 /DNA_END=276 /DNA_ORIENTATION=+
MSLYSLVRSRIQIHRKEHIDSLPPSSLPPSALLGVKEENLSDGIDINGFVVLSGDDDDDGGEVGGMGGSNIDYDSGNDDDIVVGGGSG